MRALRASGHLASVNIVLNTSLLMLRISLWAWKRWTPTCSWTSQRSACLYSWKSFWRVVPELSTCCPQAVTSTDAWHLRLARLCSGPVMVLVYLLFNDPNHGLEKTKKIFLFSLFSELSLLMQNVYPLSTRSRTKINAPQLHHKGPVGCTKNCLYPWGNLSLSYYLIMNHHTWYETCTTESGTVWQN